MTHLCPNRLPVCHNNLRLLVHKGKEEVQYCVAPEEHIHEQVHPEGRGSVTLHISYVGVHDHDLERGIEAIVPDHREDENIPGVSEGCERVQPLWDNILRTGKGGGVRYSLNRVGNMTSGLPLPYP